MASISLGIQSEGEIAATAREAANAATQAILARLGAEGIDAANIRSGAVRLQPRYSSNALRSGQRTVGNRALNA